MTGSVDTDQPGLVPVSCIIMVKSLLSSEDTVVSEGQCLRSVIHLLGLRERRSRGGNQDVPAGLRQLTVSTGPPQIHVTLPSQMPVLLTHTHTQVRVGRDFSDQVKLTSDYWYLWSGCGPGHDLFIHTRRPFAVVLQTESVI